MPDNSHGSDTTSPSSPMVGLRTTIMIVFLVSIPLMAVVGTGFPDSVRNAMQSGSASMFSSGSASHTPAPAAKPPAGAIPQSTSLVAGGQTSPPAAAQPAAPQPASHSQPQAMPPRAEPTMLAAAAEPALDRPQAMVTAVRSESNVPRARITAVRGLPDAPASVATAPLWAPSPRTASTTQGRQTTAHFESSQRRDRSRSGLNPAKRSVADATLQATAYSPPAAPRGPVAESARESQFAMPRDASSADALAHSERRLRELGATQYRLETWGESGQLFRCSAAVALPGRRRASRHFDAVAAGPSQAIEQLLAQVEAWRAQQR